MLDNPPPRLDLTTHMSSPQINTPILSYIVHPLPFTPTPIPPIQDSTMQDLHGLVEQQQLRRVMPTAPMPDKVDCGKSCPINGGKRFARGAQIWTVGMIIKMMEDRLGVRIRLNSCTTIHIYTLVI
jgi:hypothetical protein